MNDIKVSVFVVTYKHAKYIRKCLDSILSQRVNFKYEIVVGEDCSNDGTREILLEYKEKYPDIFALLLNEKNMGPNRNVHNVLMHCQGQYLAGCEGDDFWMDEYKMQKQADFLDAHPEYSAVGTNTAFVDCEGKNPKPILLKWQVNKTYTLKDYLRYGMVIHGNSLMQRNDHLYADERYCALFFAEPTMSDVITRVMMYDAGKLYVLPDVAHAHRDGRENLTSFSAAQPEKSLEHTRMYFRIVDNIAAYFDGGYDLCSLKANRMGAVLLGRLMKRNRMDMAQYWELWKTLPWKVRLVSLERCAQKFVRRAVGVIGKKLGMYSK